MAGFLLTCRAGAASVQTLGTGRGLAVRTWGGGAEVLVVQGDPVTDEEPPAGAPVADLVDWTNRSHARFCAVAVRGDTAVVWSDVGATCPVHHARTPTELLVSTSAAALLPHLGRPAEIGPAGYAALPGGRFRGVSPVPANSAVTLAVDSLDPDPLEVRRIRPLPGRPRQTDPERAVAAVRDALAASVARMAGGLGEAGALLSGGVDSSSVAALAAREVPTLRTYTVGTPYGDEFDQAAWFAERLGSDHHELMFEPEDLRALLPEMIRALETWDLLTLQIAAPACFLIDRLGGAGRRVLLSGYGADLLFAGLGGGATEADTEHDVVVSSAATARSNEFTPAFADARDVAVRHPYWSHEVMAAAMDVRGRLKVRAGTVKWVLRTAVAPMLPEPVAWRPKHGIHEGTAMDKMFAAVLGTADRRAQAEALFETACVIFQEEIYAGLAGVAS